MEIVNLLVETNRNSTACRLLKERCALSRPLTDILDYARENVPYYADLDSSLTFPCVDRATIAQTPERFTAQASPSPYFDKISTSGRSGTALSVYLDAAASAARVFLPVAQFYDHIPQLRDVRPQATKPCHAILREGLSFPTAPLLNPLVSYARMQNFIVDGIPPDQIDRQLNALIRFGAPVINSYPRALLALAAHVESNAKLRDGFSPSLRCIVSSGDNLDEGDRAAIESAFDVPVYNAYASTEAAVVAIQCPESRAMHILETNNVVEVLDEASNSERRSTGYGEIVITSLLTKPMVFIHYKTGDYGRISDSCSCGAATRTIEELDGRVTLSFNVAGSRLNPYLALDPIFSKHGIRKFAVTFIAGAYLVEFTNDQLSHAVNPEQLRRELSTMLQTSDVQVTRVPGFRDRKHMRYRIEGASSTRVYAEEMPQSNYADQRHAR